MNRKGMTLDQKLNGRKPHIRKSLRGFWMCENGSFSRIAESLEGLHRGLRTDNTTLCKLYRGEIK